LKRGLALLQRTNGGLAMGRANLGGGFVIRQQLVHIPARGRANS